MKLSFNHFNHWLQKYDIISTHSLCESGRKESEDWGCSSTNIVRQNIQHLSIVVWPPVAANNEVTRKCLLKFFSQERRWDSRHWWLQWLGILESHLNFIEFYMHGQLETVHCSTLSFLAPGFPVEHAQKKRLYPRPQHHCSSREKIAVCLEKDQRAVCL